MSFKLIFMYCIQLPLLLSYKLTLTISIRPQFEHELYVIPF